MFKLILSILIFTSAINAGWQRLATTGNVPHLKNASAIYDPSGNRMIVFGGRNSTGISGEMWSLSLNDNNWVQIMPNGGPNPNPRYTHNAYYDPTNNTMIIWSGQGNAGALYNDVWVFNLSSNQWSLIWADSNVSGAPLKRYGTASVFEPVSRKITTFAGFTSNGRFDDTWTFDVTNRVWQNQTNTSHPPKRCLHSAVYAGQTGRMIIYGGQDTGPLDDIWQCTLSNYTWANITPVAKPPARFWNSMIYYGSGNVLIFGGLGTSPMNDMWKFRMGPNLWEPVNQGSNKPAARWGQQTIFIPEQDKMVIFGGEGDSLFTDTWAYTNVSAIGIQQISNEVPQTFSLEQNYPNPFNPQTKIRFSVPANSQAAELSVYDINGKLISILVNEILPAGKYESVFEGTALPSGVYFYVLKSGDFKISNKMILIK